MIPSHHRFARPGRSARGRFSLVLIGIAAMLCSRITGYAIGVPKNLGNGLDRLVASDLMLKQQAVKRGVSSVEGAYEGYATEAAANTSKLMVQDSSGRLLVRVNFSGELKYNKARKAALRAAPSFQITGQDKSYRAGVIEGYVAIGDVPELASARGVRAVIMSVRPIYRSSRLKVPKVELAAAPGAAAGEVITQLGTYTDQGVIQHRVDQINKYYNPSAPVTKSLDGAGLSIACLSYSFNANTARPASVDVANYDLPGSPSNPVGNTTPVFVLKDDLSSTTNYDEGRGMCEIVYKMAPKAKVGFATTNLGEVNFANAIRGLAGINSADFPNASSQGFAADVICDDAIYYDEPFYEDGVVAGAVEDVAAAGVSYFSAAGNDIGASGYESVIRVVPNGAGLTAAAGNTALANTNIDLTNVPPNLYAGGFHNFDPDGGLDVAQTVNATSPANAVPTILQWNDPYDQAGAGATLAVFYTNTGTISSATPSLTYNGSSNPPVPAFTAGVTYQIVEKHTSGTYDAKVTVRRPDGTTLISQDTAQDETVIFTAPVSGQYQIVFTASGGTTGNFTFTIGTATFAQHLTSDWNLLAFRTDTGAYVPASSLTTDNLASNQPVEIGVVSYTSSAVRSIQYVLARSNTPPAGVKAADHIRYLLSGNGITGLGPQEYFSYNTVTTYGHAMSPSCNGTAAYSAFRPNIPQGFSSPGAVTVYFDKNQNRLATPSIRLQPGVAALNGGNISSNLGLAGLGSDSNADTDTAPEFYGTSAAAAHAAACALLTLQAHGGRHSVTPAQMTTILHQTAFPHDLDPNMATGAVRGVGGKVTLTFASDNESNTGTGLNDANSLAVSYNGPSYVKTLVFNPAGTAAAGGNVTGGNNGLDASNAYFSNSFPGMVFPAATTSFLVGDGSVGLTAADVTAATSNPAGPPSTTQNYTLTLNFPNNNFTGGKLLHFTISRSIQHSATLPSGGNAFNYSADLFGGGVLIPEGTIINPGMAFRATLGDGAVLNGNLVNSIGQGYSKLDGFGFINAQAAAAQPLP